MGVPVAPPCPLDAPGIEQRACPENLLHPCSLDDGDVARMLTRTVDLLRQASSAVANPRRSWSLQPSKQLLRPHNPMARGTRVLWAPTVEPQLPAAWLWAGASLGPACINNHCMLSWPAATSCAPAARCSAGWLL